MTKEIVVKVNNFNRSYYEKIGIKFSINKDLKLPIEQLSPGSEKKVVVQCDYCGRIFEKRYRFFLEGRNASVIKKDCCDSCQKFKNQEALQEKYNVSNVSFLSTVKRKISKNKRGDKHHNWQGGIGGISDHLRNLVLPWRDEILRNKNYTCEISEKKGTVQVHHMHPFNMIVKEVLKRLRMPVKSVGEYSYDELKIIEKTFENRHRKLSMPIVLLKDIHLLYHRKYGYKGGPKEFSEFVKEYRSANGF